MKNRIRLMSHNVWNRDENSPEWKELGQDCSAKVRVKGLIRVYKETMPDVIGCQEVSSLMADLLSQEFEREKLKYTIVWGRFTPVIYRADKFELIDSEFHTYAEKIDGFDGEFNDVKSKAYNICVFREKQSGKVFVFATTHLWWKTDTQAFATKLKRLADAHYFSGLVREDYAQAHSDEAREYQLALLTQRIKEYAETYACPAIVVGDLNTGYNSKAVQTALKFGFKHAHDIATEYAEESVGYHYCFPDGFETKYYDTPFEEAIDHILVYKERQGMVKRFERYSPEYYFPVSDHSPVYVDIEL